MNHLAEACKRLACLAAIAKVAERIDLTAICHFLPANQWSIKRAVKISAIASRIVHDGAVVNDAFQTLHHL
ncbi:hypothetical protein CSQ91_12760 [Janthinobacterium sp. BJB301]|nr:hypothetical protein CSQ91_12760 [Janthinobacterium sp. BJB301]